MGLFKRKESKGVTKKSSEIPDLPELPKLSDFSPTPSSQENVPLYEEEKLPQLPTFPDNDLGNRFTQNTIKEAVAGEKEEEEVFAMEDGSGEEMLMMQKPLIKKSFSREYDEYEQSINKSKPEKKFSMEYEEDDSNELPEIEENYERSEPLTPIAPPIKSVTPPKKTVKAAPRVIEDDEEKYTVKNYMTKKAEPVFIRIDKFEESIKIFQDIKSQISEIEKLIKNTKEIKAKEEEELLSWEKEIQTIKNQIEKVNQDIFSRVG